jgi:prepilin-type N-terminal cleavage/methylation domain-containing protein/prepilin-type processing-associated H-X9-DG protein
VTPCRQQGRASRAPAEGWSRQPRARGGFTLVELLVVMTIIGILMGLLLPAVNAAREQARRSQCMNNLRQLGIGCQSHLAHQGFFPTGGWFWNWVGDPDRGFHKEQNGGLFYNILPYVDQAAIHQAGAGQSAAAKAQLNVTVVQTPLLFANCPSRRRPITFANLESYGNVSSVSLAARTDYAACYGDTVGYYYCQASSLPPYGTWPPTDSSASCVAGWGGAGFNGVSFPRSEVKAAQVFDGLNQTILLGEKNMDPNVYYTGTDPADNENLYVGFDNDTYRTACYDRTQPDSSSNGKPPMQDTPGYQDQYRFGSAHATNCNFVFCDGSVKSINYLVDALVFANLCSRNDQNPIDEKSF